MADLFGNFETTDDDALDTEKKPSAQEGVGPGARVYGEPVRRHRFPYWIFLLVLIPVLYFLFQPREESRVAPVTNTPPVVAPASGTQTLMTNQ